METTPAKAFSGSHFTQVAWVVKDIEATKRFFNDVMGLRFGKVATSRAKDYDGTYYGKPSDAESLVAQIYSGGTFIELIQPVSGNSVFQDYLDKNPAGGIQHVAYGVPVGQLDEVISETTAKGFPVVATYDTSIAKIVFFDTSKENGVMTEVMGITKEGEEQIALMKKQMG